MAYDREIRNARERAGLTLEGLARRARVSPRTLQRYESGEREPTVGVALRIARVCEDAEKRRVRS